MDLTRAKTVLIIAFLALNIYLGYQLWERSEVLPFMSVTSEEANQVMRQLEENNYTMIASLPRQTEKMSLLSVQALLHEEEAVAKTIFPEVSNLAEFREEEDGEVIYTRESESLIFKGRGRLSYRHLAKEDADRVLEKEEIPLQAEEFLSAFQIMPEDAELGSIYANEEGEMVASYYQIYEELSLYSSYLHVYFQGSVPVGFDMFWLEPSDFSGESRHVIPATQALLRFLEIQGPAQEEEAILNITLGYYSREYDAQKWDVVPVWRIRTSEENIIYINAYSGDEEKS